MSGGPWREEKGRGSPTGGWAAEGGGAFYPFESVRGPLDKEEPSARWTRAMTTSASCAGESARGFPDEEASAPPTVAREADERLLRGRERKGLPGRGREALPWRMGEVAPRTAATTCSPVAAGSFQGLDPDLEREREAYIEREMGEVK